VEELVSSDNPESKAGGSIATNRVFQAGYVKRVETRQEKYQEEGNFFKNSSDDRSSVISKDLKRRVRRRGRRRRKLLGDLKAGRGY
jgi:hypothetical protein